MMALGGWSEALVLGVCHETPPHSGNHYYHMAGGGECALVLCGKVGV